MRVVKKHGLFISLFIVSVAFSTLFSSSASAGTYPNFTLTNTLYVAHFSLSNGLCNPPLGDITFSWYDYFSNKVKFVYGDLQYNYQSFKQQLINNINGANGGWAIQQINGANGQMIRVIVFDPSVTVDFSNVSGESRLKTTSPYVSIKYMEFFEHKYDNGCGKLRMQNNGNIYYVNNIPIDGLLYWNGHVNYPAGYQGPSVSDGSAIDNDGDGLNTIQEMQQGTSDNNVDSDGDGISDFKESVWFPDRDEVFCDTTVTQHVCAYPNAMGKDLYAEIDWMKDPTTNKIFKPSSTQINLLTTMYANEGINFHADTGQFGGGNELTDYAEYLQQIPVNAAPDFLDYRYGGDSISSNFASKRLGIWRYIIYGNKYSTPQGNSTSSGWSAVLGDNLFISGGIIENIASQPDTQDRVVANTIAHELGHSLCLSDDRAYIEQSADCVYKGIDNRSGQPPANSPDSYYDLASYKSVMNYRYQLTDVDDLGVVDYSHGSNSLYDHDDWSAIKANMGGFSGAHTVYIEFGAQNKSTPPKVLDGEIIIEEPPVQDMQQVSVHPKEGPSQVSTASSDAQAHSPNPDSNMSPGKQLPSQSSELHKKPQIYQQVDILVTVIMFSAAAVVLLLKK